MILIYNLLLTFFFLPLLTLITITLVKYRDRNFERLGLKIKEISPIPKNRSIPEPVIWIHALSVGEVTSARPLIQAIREDMNSTLIVFTAATRSGRQLATTLISPYADIVLYSPFDLRVSVQRYISAIEPDLFILVETDFWPNWLLLLKKHRVPIMLVNGRVSYRSYTNYNRFLFFFKPIFRCFDLLSMQTLKDAKKMTHLGVDSEKVITLGNLKYDMGKAKVTGSSITRTELAVDKKKMVWVCGSTHPGEEEILFAAFKKLAGNKELFLILAPRDISRGNKLVDLAQQFNLDARTRSSRTTGGNVLILDTIGELASCYGLARMAFVGGSLVAQGGHNPIEPAVHGVPVLFGNHMEDFSEIADDLIACGGGKTVTADSLATVATTLLTDNDLHASMAKAGLNLVEQHRGGVKRHLEAIHKLLNQ